tara:strand:- start:1061 stop:1489 length:429 start_codon:yes stop_codon:yes gene_type:complete
VSADKEMDVKQGTRCVNKDCSGLFRVPTEEEGDEDGHSALEFICDTCGMKAYRQSEHDPAWTIPWSTSFRIPAPDGMLRFVSTRNSYHAPTGIITELIICKEIAIEDLGDDGYINPWKKMPRLLWRRLNGMPFNFGIASCES